MQNIAIHFYAYCVKYYINTYTQIHRYTHTNLNTEIRTYIDRLGQIYIRRQIETKRQYYKKYMLPEATYDPTSLLFVCYLLNL